MGGLSLILRCRMDGLRRTGDGHRLGKRKPARLCRRKADHKGQKVEKQPHQSSPAGDIGANAPCVHPARHDLPREALQKREPND